jgi:hypothetical protein
MDEKANIVLDVMDVCNRATSRQEFSVASMTSLWAIEVKEKKERIFKRRKKIQKKPKNHNVDLIFINNALAQTMNILKWRFICTIVRQTKGIILQFGYLLRLNFDWTCTVSLQTSQADVCKVASLVYDPGATKLSFFFNSGPKKVLSLSLNVKRWSANLLKMMPPIMASISRKSSYKVL